MIEGTGRDRIVDYISVEGEHIKVVSGPVVKSRSYRVFSTRVWADGKMQKEYFSDELKLGWIPVVRRRLEELAESGAPLDEILSAIDTQADVLRDNEAIEADDAERFKEFE